MFLISLDLATQFRETYPVVIYGLPFAGLFIGWIYHRYGRDVSAGTNLILDEIHDPRATLPWTMAPLILGSTVLTHLFGGSAGREGTAVQMGASLSDRVGKYFKVEASERKILLVAGAGAGFGAAIGAPWAGVIFGMEVIQVGRLKFFAWFECLVASFAGYATAVFLRAPHSAFPTFEIPRLSVSGVFYIAVAGVAFGLMARLFTMVTHLIERSEARWISSAPLRPFFGGIFLLIFFWFEGSTKFAGLGIPSIQAAFETSSGLFDPFLKLIATALTIGSGFKGGEFIPLVFMGTTLGSALALVLPMSLPLLAGVGFAAVFGAAANTPIACTVMAMELFGPRIGPYALIACGVGFLVSGPKGIYRSQKPFIRRGLPD